MGRPKGAKNKRTLLREAEQKLLSVKREDFLDAMVVLEGGMRHFYSRAVQLKSTGKADPKEIDDNLLKAVDLAEKIMPYRHHRLAAIKLDKDPVMGGLHENASLAELEAEMKKGLGLRVDTLTINRCLAFCAAALACTANAPLLPPSSRPENARV
jgi:hypothetical protein